MPEAKSIVPRLTPEKGLSVEGCIMHAGGMVEATKGHLSSLNYNVTVDSCLIDEWPQLTNYCLG